MSKCLHHILHQNDFYKEDSVEVPNYHCAQCHVEFYAVQHKEIFAKESGSAGGRKLVEKRGSDYMKQLGKKAAEKRWGNKE